MKKVLYFRDVRLCHGHIQVFYIPNELNEVDGNLGCRMENVGEQ